ncbi:MAG: M23 family metallopeptidase [Blastocatellia bacterium]
MKYVGIVKSLLPCLLLSFLTNAQSVLANTQPASAEVLSVTSEPAIPVNGSPVLFRVKSGAVLRSLAGELQKRRIAFDFDAGTGAWYGFAGIDLDTPAGRYSLKLDALALDGAPFSSVHLVTTSRARYRSTTLSVPRKYLEPDPETQKRIEEERALKSEVFNNLTPVRLWSGSFAAPIVSVTTEPFGVQRTFNNVRQSVHQGLDYRASTGSPVQAMNSGVVVLAREMFYEGGLVVIDHGHGLLSLYLHLSEFRVKEGDRVAKMQLIGLSGESGRTTGPHLHVGIRWLGVYVDPATLLRLPLP